MTHRERMSAVLDRSAPDRVPFSPRMDLWYNAHSAAGTLPPAWRELSLREIESELGLTTPARAGRIYRVERDGVETVTRSEGDRRVTQYRTAVGTLRTVTRRSGDQSRAGMNEIVEEYPLKEASDYRVWEHIVERTRWIPDYEAYEAYDREIGDQGLPLVSVGDVPFHFYIQKLAGYDHGFYHLADWPQVVERLLEVMASVERERLWPVIADSPARLVLHGGHFSSQMTPPPLFDRFMLPYYEGLMPLLHEAGKTVAMHADADLSLILDQVRRAGWDMLECFVTAPMVRLTMEKARAVFGNRVILWGGIPSVLLSPSCPEEDFRRYVREAARIVAPGDAVIFGIADNVMPDSLIDRVRWIAEFVAEQGYPLRG